MTKYVAAKAGWKEAFSPLLGVIPKEKREKKSVSVRNLGQTYTLLRYMKSKVE